MRGAEADDGIWREEMGGAERTCNEQRIHAWWSLGRLEQFGDVLFRQRGLSSALTLGVLLLPPLDVLRAATTVTLVGVGVDAGKERRDGADAARYEQVKRNDDKRKWEVKTKVSDKKINRSHKVGDAKNTKKRRERGR